MVLVKTEVAVASLVSELMDTFHKCFPIHNTYIMYPPDYEVSIPTMYIHL